MSSHDPAVFVPSSQKKWFQNRARERRMFLPTVQKHVDIFFFLSYLVFCLIVINISVAELELCHSSENIEKLEEYIVLLTKRQNLNRN